MRERRGHLRVRVSIPVVCKTSDGDVLGGVLTDLGLGGSRVICTQAPTIGTALTIAVHLPESAQPSRLPAIVRWTWDGAFGVQFGLLGARDTRLIAELLAKAGRTA
jgi:hypothetical protein